MPEKPERTELLAKEKQKVGTDGIGQKLAEAISRHRDMHF